eukprot:359194-Chlamydomonas_euryale.AAC.20
MAPWLHVHVFEQSYKFELVRTMHCMHGRCAYTPCHAARDSPRHSHAMQCRSVHPANVHGCQHLFARAASHLLSAAAPELGHPENVAEARIPAQRPAPRLPSRARPPFERALLQAGMTAAQATTWQAVGAQGRTGGGWKRALGIWAAGLWSTGNGSDGCARSQGTTHGWSLSPCRQDGVGRCEAGSLDRCDKARKKRCLPASARMPRPVHRQHAASRPRRDPQDAIAREGPTEQMCGVSGLSGPRLRQSSMHM